MKSMAIALLLVYGVICPQQQASAADYDPLQAGEAKVVAPLDMVVRDASRNRDIPVRVYLPAATSPPAPVVLFSHGLGGSRENSAYLGKHWAARGYVVVFLQHPGSDESVWKGVPPARILPAMNKAASAENFLARVRDVSAVLDQLSDWNTEPAASDVTSKLVGRMDMDHVGMSGHSFGAVTTQAVAGQSFVGKQATFTDPRIQAAVMMSPSAPRVGAPEKAFGQVHLPWLLLTGTHDVGKIGGQTPESRRRVFPALPSGDKYQLVLDGAEHSAFSDRALPGDRHGRNPNHHRAVLAITTAFWDTYLRNDAAAKAWLESDQVREVLDSADLWERK